MRKCRPLLLCSLGGCLSVLLISSVAYAQHGVQVTPDGKRNLISKDVGDERWAITYNLDDQTVTGNVFFPGGGEPAFVWCQPTSEDSCTVSLQCSGADKCVSAPCSTDAWQSINTVQLPLAFFLPPGTLPTQNIAGTFAGTGSDSSGPATMFWTLTQSDAFISGEVSASTPSGSVTGQGSISGTICGATLTFTISGSFPPPLEGCAVTITGTAQVTTTTITGTYTGSNSCTGPFTNGEFTLDRTFG